MDFSNGYATSATAANMFKNTTDADFELTFDYLHTDVSSSAKKFDLHLRFQSSSDEVRLEVRPDGMKTLNYNGGTQLGAVAFTASANVCYQLKVVAVAVGNSIREFRDRLIVCP